MPAEQEENKLPLGLKAVTPRALVDNTASRAEEIISDAGKQAFGLADDTAKTLETGGARAGDLLGGLMSLSQKYIGAAVGIGMKAASSAVDTVKDVAGLGLNAAGLGKDKKAGAGVDNAADAKKGGAESTLDGAALVPEEPGRDLASQEQGMDRVVGGLTRALGTVSNVANSPSTGKSRVAPEDQAPVVDQPVVDALAQVANALLGSNKDNKKQSQPRDMDEGIGPENALSMNFEQQIIARQKRQGVGHVADSDDDMSAGAEFDETPDSKQASQEKGTGVREQIARSIASVIDEGIEMDSSAQQGSQQSQKPLRLGPPTSNERSSSEAAIGNAFKDVKQSSALSTSVPMAANLAENLAKNSGGQAK